MPDTVNSRGDILSQQDIKDLTGWASTLDPGSHIPKYSPQRAAELLFNWLTAGGLPKPYDPGTTFAESQRTAGMRAKSASGQGISGLFGAGLLIGDLVPKTGGLAPGGENFQSPMQAGVPYSVMPMAKLPGAR